MFLKKDSAGAELTPIHALKALASNALIFAKANKDQEAGFYPAQEVYRNPNRVLPNPNIRPLTKDPKTTEFIWRPWTPSCNHSGILTFNLTMDVTVTGECTGSCYNTVFPVHLSNTVYTLNYYTTSWFDSRTYVNDYGGCSLAKVLVLVCYPNTGWEFQYWKRGTSYYTYTYHQLEFRLGRSMAPGEDPFNPYGVYNVFRPGTVPWPGQSTLSRTPNCPAGAITGSVVVS